ncbi:MAG: hypothetical protein AB4372_10590 [Xenococcus sp. (in: cyanobacteria)]
MDDQVIARLCASSDKINHTLSELVAGQIRIEESIKSQRAQIDYNNSLLWKTGNGQLTLTERVALLEAKNQALVVSIERRNKQIWTVITILITVIAGVIIPPLISKSNLILDAVESQAILSNFF